MRHVLRDTCCYAQTVGNTPTISILFPPHKSPFWHILPMARNTGNLLIKLLHGLLCGSILPHSHKQCQVKPVLGDFPDDSPIVLLTQLLVLIVRCPIPHLLHLREWESNFPLDSFATHQLTSNVYPDIPNFVLSLFSFIGIILAFITIPWHLQVMQITNSVLH